ncbi:MAG: MFS transporter [Elainellaceae cyanobacterium]
MSDPTDSAVGQPPWLSWLPDLTMEVWILSAGQLLLFIGQGVTLVYASIYFVNELGFSPTQVGLAQGSMGLSGTLGRFWAGNAVDSQRLGRRGTLLLAAAIAAMGSLVLAAAQTLTLLVLGNLLLGLGISLYWPATLTVLTDLTTDAQRTDAMAVTRLADNLGLGLGALIAGQYIAAAGSYRTLFIAKGLAYIVFGGIVAVTIAEPRPAQTPPRPLLASWRAALSDRHLLTYLAANLFFTTFTAQLSTTLPLYLTRTPVRPFSDRAISYFFGWHALLKIGLQLPALRLLRSRSHSDAMRVSLALWSGGFVFMALVGVSPSGLVSLTAIAFALVAIAEILYGPSASALVADLAPASLRGVYFSLDSECWAIGFLVGPALGGWALDHSDSGAALGVGWGVAFWLLLMASAAIAALLLRRLHRQLTP